ncbi:MULTISPECIES: hypothetical protein [Larkinella]|jgi:hypothetical protein|uniref:hypothetical protein n=1 Tax=Larkinella TaxID=332157 RepID=UPI001058FB74|nr:MULTISPECIES: hypothetical protein [Larkinella]
MKNRKSVWLGGLSIFACGVCCSLPILGPLIGVAVLASLATWLESLAILLLGVGVVFFLLVRLRKKTTGAVCSTACNCNPKQIRVDQTTVG